MVRAHTDGYFVFNMITVAWEYNLLWMLQNYILGAFKPACNITITFADAKTRKQVCTSLCHRPILYMYYTKSLQVVVFLSDLCGWCKS